MYSLDKNNGTNTTHTLKKQDRLNLPIIDKVEAAIIALQQGHPILIVDDEVEGEGDVCIPAQLATPEVINFMAVHCRGIICQSITLEMSNQLDLPLMVPDGGSPAFTITADSSLVGSGTSAFDRALTAQTIARLDATSNDLVKPGHMFPIIARPGGVLERPGHTEASSDLARLAGFAPSGVICEVMAEDGHMARPMALVSFAEKHNMKSITVSELIIYRKTMETNGHKNKKASLRDGKHILTKSISSEKTQIGKQNTSRTLFSNVKKNGTQAEQCN